MSKVQAVQEEAAQEVGSNKLCLVLSKETIDMVYPAFLKLAPVGNPASASCIEAAGHAKECPWN